MVKLCNPFIKVRVARGEFRGQMTTGQLHPSSFPIAFCHFHKSSTLISLDTNFLVLISLNLNKRYLVYYSVKVMIDDGTPTGRYSCDYLDYINSLI